jgi:CheY-like chemotaxis protein
VTQGAPIHFVHFYEEGCFPAGSVADFLWAGLRAGESAIIIASQEHARASKDLLATRGAALDALERRGRLIVLDARTTLESVMRGRTPDRALLLSVVGPILDRAAAASPSGRARICGELVATLADEDSVAVSLGRGMLELERLWNEMLSTRPCRLYCAYPIRLFAHRSLAGAFTDVCDAHDQIIPVSTWLDKHGNGARAIAVLQQQACALQEALARERPDSLQAIPEDPSKGARADVLVVDNDADVRCALRNVLELQGYHVALAANGREAWERLQSTPLPALILLDLMMPVMNGAELLERVRADTRLWSLPVVLITAFRSLAEPVTAESQGFLAKPFDVEQLLNLASRFCPPRPN